MPTLYRGVTCAIFPPSFLPSLPPCVLLPFKSSNRSCVRDTGTTSLSVLRLGDERAVSSVVRGHSICVCGGPGLLDSLGGAESHRGACPDVRLAGVAAPATGDHSLRHLFM